MKDICDIVDSYKVGNRYFLNLDFDKGDSLTEQFLSEAIFENCYLSVNFIKTDFSNTKFINCNLKYCEFTNCNLTNSIFDNCSLNIADFNNARIDGISFVNCNHNGQKVHFDDVINKLITSKDQLVEELYNNVPEFSDMIDHEDDELPYVVFGHLSLILSDDIIKSDVITDFTQKCFNFFNKLADRNNNEIDNLLVVGIYEGLYSKMKYNDISRKLLIGRNKELYEHWMINGNIRSEY
jgi:hypothetical protein